MVASCPLAFLLMAGAFVAAYPSRWLRVAIACVLAAFLIELLQFLSATCHSELGDAMVKAIGAVFGVFNLVRRGREQIPV